MHSTSGSHHQNHRQKNSLCYCPKNWLHLVFVWSRLCWAAVVVIISFILWTAAVSRIFGLLENIKLNERFPTFSTHPTIVRQMSVSWCQWSSHCTMIENYLVFLEAEIPKSNSRNRNWIYFSGHLSRLVFIYLQMAFKGWSIINRIIPWQLIWRNTLWSFSLFL